MSFEVKFEIDQTQDNSVSRKILMGSGAFDSQGMGSSTNGSNVKIHVTNLDSLDEYEGVSIVNNDYLPKLQSWINKKKYTCSENISNDHQKLDDEDDLLQLQVDIFKFYLKKIEKSDMDKIKEEMEQLKHERLMIDREMKLFNFYFFSMSKQESIGAMKQGISPQSFNPMQQFGFGGPAPHQTIFSTDQLFYTIQAQGIIEPGSGNQQQIRENGDQQMIGEASGNIETSAFSDELSRSNNAQQQIGQSNGGSHQQSKTQYLLELKEPLAHDVLSLSLNGQGPQSKNFEFVLYGQGCKNHIVAKMAKNYVRKTVHVDVTLYYYPVNVSVKNSGNYTLYIPKTIN